MKVLLLTSVAALLAICVSATRADDTSSNQKPLGYWVERLASDQDEIRTAANNALRIYEQWLSDSPFAYGDGNPYAERDRIRAELKPFVSSLVTLLGGEYEDSRATAAGLLGVVGTDASVADPALLKIIRSKQTSGNMRMMAVVAWLHFMPPDKPVGPLLLDAFKSLDLAKEDEDAGDNTAGAEISAVYIALVLISSGRTIIEVPTLAELTNSKYRRGYRATAIIVLAELGSDATAAIPELRKLLTDEDSLIRQAAGQAIIHIAGNATELPAILKAMNLDEKERVEFEQSISEFFEEQQRTRKTLRDSGSEILEFVIRQLRFGQPFFQRQAIHFLKEIGPAATVAIPELLAATKSDDKATREAAISALKRVDISVSPKAE